MLNKPVILSIHNQFPTSITKKYNLYGGVGYYRQRMPAKFLSQYAWNHAGSQLVDISGKEMEDRVVELVKGSAMVFTKHLDNPYAIYTLLGACKHFDKPLIVDFDDNVFTTDGLSPEKHSYEGVEEKKHYLETLLRECTAITVSTKPLMGVYEKYNDVHLLPNACDPKDWGLPLRHNDRPTVGWAGSLSHVVDHPVLEPVYREVLRTHPEALFSFVGHMLPQMLRLPKKSYEIKQGISWWEGNPENPMTYPRLLAECGYDVGLAPLIPSQFNQSRSLVKWFEYTMAGIPLIASEWGPYLDLRDEEDAYLVQTTDGWITAINYLLENPNERKRLVETSRARILSEFSIERIGPLWGEVCSQYLGNGF